MSIKATLSAILMLVSVSACGGSSQSSRNLTPDYLPQAATVTATAVAATAAPLAIRGIEVLVPDSLKVSEADVYFPFADIVWRGDPMGDRHPQVAAMFQVAAAQASEGITEGRGAIMTLQVTRFHAVTEKARYKVGGGYEMNFLMTMRDAETGIILDGPREVNPDFKGSGGIRAVAEDNAGRTEKVVVIEKLTEFLRIELANLGTQAAL
jgi:hypothetical protein